MKESVQPHVPQFSGKNYDRWSIQMKVLFGFRELTEVVEAGFFDVNDPVVGAALPQAHRDELRENKRKDKKALYFIHQAQSLKRFLKLKHISKHGRYCRKRTKEMTR